MKRTTLPLAAALITGSFTLLADEISDLAKHAGCAFGSTFEPKEKIPAPLAGVHGFSSNNDAKFAIEKIMAHSGLEPNFRIIASSEVGNAAAVIHNDERLILYNTGFMAQMKSATNTDWAGYAVLAHEVGHHLQGHTLSKGGSRPPFELQADKYAGFVLGMMGSSLDNALAVFRSLPSAEGSKTHPPKSERLVAVTNGWSKAKATIAKNSGGGGGTKTTPAASPHTSDVSKDFGSQYVGTLNAASARFSIVWHDDGTVSGSYYLQSRGSGNRRRLVGSNDTEGKLYLEEFSGSQVSARYRLSKTLTSTEIIWSGNVTGIDGVTKLCSFRRNRDNPSGGGSSSGPPAASSSSVSSSSNYDGTLGGKSVRVALNWHKDDAVSGSYTTSSGRVITLRGDNSVSGKVAFREYEGSTLVARSNVSKTIVNGKITWAGNSTDVYGTSRRFSFSRSTGGSSSPVPTTAAVAKGSNYVGKVGQLSAQFSIHWGDNDAVTGSYYYPAWGQNTKFFLRGHNRIDGQLHLTETQNGSQNATVFLKKQMTGSRITWKGTWTSNSGDTTPIEFSRPR